MESSKSYSGIDRSHGRSVVEKSVFGLVHFSIVLFCFWLVFFDGWTTIGQVFSREWVLADKPRALILLACAVLFWGRHMIVLFYLLVRKITWSEALGLLPFMALFEIGLVLVGGGAFRDYSIGLGWLDVAALGLVLTGSWLNSFSEIQRKWWKKNLENKGHCYTKGLFSHSMHINYFGDVVLFTGWCLFTYNMWTLALPVVMAASFIFFHIPGLDEYLAHRYGAEFEAYAVKTKKLIPFVY